MAASGIKRHTTTLIACALIAIFATACNSSSSDDPIISAALPEQDAVNEVLLAESAREAGCPSEVHGLPVTLSDTPISTDTLERVGGACVFGEAAYAVAHASAQETFVSKFCELAQKYADELGGGDYALAQRKVTEYVNNSNASRSDVQPMLFALSGCASASAKSDAAASLVSGTSAKIYSVGTYTENDRTCDGVLWSQQSKNIEHYQLTGLNGCTLKEPSASIVFHPDARPDGQPLGNYFRDTLAYTGDMPTNFRYKGRDYPFYTSAATNLVALKDQSFEGNNAIDSWKKTTSQFRDWAYTNEQDPIGISYVRSSYSRYAADAAYAVRADNEAHEIFVNTKRGCEGRDYVEYRISKTVLDAPASCVEVGESKLRFTVAVGDKSDLLFKAMKAGATMQATPFAIKTESPNARDPFTFSLMGFSSASSQMKKDFNLFDDAQQRQLMTQGLGEQVQTKLFEQIKKPRKAPRRAAAKPAPKQESADFVQRYAANLANQMESKLHPACGAIASNIRYVASSIAPDAMRMRQIDGMVDRAPSWCF